ncbi:M48 family metalloprotease [Candidatus Bathyarchaeota archaeon]|nr:M48 family metalloprotease [Candidatus Bathyarchaeota archaeon]
MSLLKLRLSMLGTLAILIAISTLFFTFILRLLGVFNIAALLFLVIIFNLIQWLIAPYLINALYRTREVSKVNQPKLYGIVESLSRKIGVKTPKVRIANIGLPNAFAYGSPIAGSCVAVTTGLLTTLEDEEVEAVIGHELSHLKHRDVQIMMIASVLPAIFYFIGYSLMLSGWSGGGRRNSGAATVLIGLACIAIYWILTLFVLGLSRLREYYADRRSAMTVEDGARKLSEGLAKIVTATSQMRGHRREAGGLNSFKALFISDPDHAELDAFYLSQSRELTADQSLVQSILARKVTMADRIMEAFSTHPNITKRLRALQELAL